ncbi:unnamed protein product [Closterium sp. NIES-54]
MDSPTVLTFTAEGHAVDFDVWVDDLQLFLHCDSRDRVSLFDHTHLPSAERAHFGQYKTAQSLYDTLVARYSSPSTAALSRLMLPYLFPNLAAFATVADLITHLRTSDARYRAALPTEDHYLSICPTELTVDLLEERLTTAEKSILAVNASRGDPRAPFFEGCSLVPLLPSMASAAAVDLVSTAEVGAASAHSGRRHNGKGKGGKGGGGNNGGGGGSGSGGGGGGGGGAGQSGATQRGGFGGSQRQQQPRSHETPSAQQLREWYAGRGRSGDVGPCTYVLRTGGRRGEISHAGVICLSSTLLSLILISMLSLRTLPRFYPCDPLHLLLDGPPPTFTRQPCSSLYTLTNASPPVTVSGQVAASGQVFSAASRSSPVLAPCSCRPLSHETLRWHHRLGYPSLPRLRGMASHTLGHERYFLLVIHDYSRYTTVFPLRHKGEVTEVLIDWIHGARCQLSESFGLDLPVQRLHSDIGGEFSSNLLRAFCRAEGIRQTFTLPASPHKNGIAERQIGMVIDVAPFVRDASANKLSSRAVHCVFLGFPPDAPGWQFYHPTSRRDLSSQDVTFDESVSYYRLFPYRTALLPPPPLFLAPGSHPVDPLPPEGPAPSGVSQVDPVEPVEVAVDSGAARVAEPTGAGPGGAEPGVAESECAEPGGAEPERVEPGGTESGGAVPGGAESGGAEPERAESGGPPGVPSRREPLSPQQLCEWYARRCRRAAGATGPAAGGASGAAGGAASAGGTGTVGAAGAGGGAGVGAVGVGAVSTGGAAGVGGVGGPGAGGAAGVVAGDPGAEGTGAISAVSGGAARPRPYYIALLQQVLGLPPSPSPPPLLSPPPVQSPSQLQPASPLPGPSPYSGPTRGLTEHCEPESRPVSPESRPASLESRFESHVRAVHTGHRVPRQHPPSVPSTHSMTLCPSTSPQRVPLPSLPASSLPALTDPESDSLRTASPTVTRLLATVVTDPSFESTAASALVAELVVFAAHFRLDYAASLVAESASVCPPSVKGECALSTDVLEDRQEEFECFATAVPHLVSMLLSLEGDSDAPDIPTPRSYEEAIEGPYSSQWQAAMDAEMASWKSTGTYVDEVPPPGANIGVDFFHTFSPTPKMTTLRVLLHVAAQHDYELHSLDFSTAFLQGSLHEEIWLRRPPGFTGSFPATTQWSLRRPGNACLVSGAQTGAQNEAHCSALLPCSRAAAAWSASSYLRGPLGQHCQTYML